MHGGLQSLSPFPWTFQVRSAVSSKLCPKAGRRLGAGELPVLIGLKTEMATSAKFLETNDLLCSRICRTRRVRNEMRDKHSRFTLALNLGTLEDALMLRIRSALETGGRAPIAPIFDGVLFLGNQPLSDESLQELRDEVGVIAHAKEITCTPSWRGASTEGAVTCGRVRFGLDDPRSRPPRLGLFYVTVDLRLQLICRLAPSRTGKRRNFLAAGSTQSDIWIWLREGHLRYIAPTILLVWTYLQPLWKAVRRSNCLRW